MNKGITQHRMHVPSTHHQKLHQLIALLRQDPCMRACIQRIACECVPPTVELREQGRAVKKELLAVIGPIFSHFMKEAVEMAYFCGFVAFVVKRRNNINVPLILPLGSFTWSVIDTTKNTKKRKHEDVSLYRYDVRPLHPELTEDDLYVYNFAEPVLLPSQCLPSPVDHLCSLLAKIQRLEAKLDDVMEWNAKKHVTSSERVDFPKDQTTDGISLLDDFRRYVVTGDHDSINRQFMTLNGMKGNMMQVNPNSLNANWVQRIAFGKEEENDNARVHVLPPNTDIVELSNLDLNVNPQELQTLFQQQVYLFFNITPQHDVGHTAGAAQYASRSETKHMRALAVFCQHLAEYAYACCFDVNPDEVVVELPQPSGMHISSADDVKKLSESQVLLPGDSLKIRKRLMNNV